MFTQSNLTDKEKENIWSSVVSGADPGFVTTASLGLTSSLSKFVVINMYNILQDDEIEEQNIPSRIIDRTIALDNYTKEFNAPTANHVILSTKHRKVRGESNNNISVKKIIKISKKTKKEYVLQKGYV
jgi:hypothetical protein